MQSFSLEARILTLFARCSERLGKIAQEVGRYSCVTSVSHRFEFRDYRSGPLLEGFVDAELTDGTARTLWLEMSWSEESAVLESSLLKMEHGGYQETIQEFPTRKIGSSSQLEENLVEAIEQLEDATRQVFPLEI